MATPQNYIDICIPKIIEQLSYKSRLKVSPFTNLPLCKWGFFGLLLKSFLVLMFLEVNTYCNNRGVKWVTIIFPPIFTLFV